MKKKSLILFNAPIDFLPNLELLDPSRLFPLNGQEEDIFHGLLLINLIFNSVTEVIIPQKSSFLETLVCKSLDLCAGLAVTNCKKFTIEDTYGHHGNHRKYLAQNASRPQSIIDLLIHSLHPSVPSSSQLFFYALYGQRLQDTLALLEFTASRKSETACLVHISHSSNFVDMGYQGLRMASFTGAKQNLNLKGNGRLENQLEQQLKRRLQKVQQKE